MHHYYLRFIYFHSHICWIVCVCVWVRPLVHNSSERDEHTVSICFHFFFFFFLNCIFETKRERSSCVQLSSTPLFMCIHFSFFSFFSALWLALHLLLLMMMMMMQDKKKRGNSFLFTGHSLDSVRTLRMSSSKKEMATQQQRRRKALAA